MNRKHFLTILLLTASAGLWSNQPTLNNPSMSQIYTGGSDLLDQVQSICYVLGAMCAIVGAVMTYTEIIDGEENLYVAVRNWFGGCLAFIVFPSIIRALAGF